MANLLAVNKVIKAIHYIYNEMKKAIAGDRSFTANDIFNNKAVKGFLPKSNYRYDPANTTDKTTSTQCFFYTLKQSVERTFVSLRSDGPEKAEKLWHKLWINCENVIKMANSKSRIKDNHLRVPLEKLENVFGESKPKITSNGSKTKVDSNKPPRNKKVRGIINAIDRFIKSVDKNYKLENYSKNNIYVLKKMFSDCFSEYINEKTASGKYFVKGQKNLGDLDFKLYLILGGTDNIDEIKNNDKYRTNAYTIASGKVKDEFPKCFPDIEENLTLSEKVTSSLKNRKVREGIGRMRKLFEGRSLVDGGQRVAQTV